MSEQVCRTINGSICLSTSALCEVLQVSRPAITDWVQKGCPKATRGWFPLKEVLEWRGLVNPGNLKTADQAEEISLATKKLAAEAELKRQKMLEATFDNAVAQGEYLKKDEVTAELKRYFVVLKRSLMALPRRITTDLAGKISPIEARRIDRDITEIVYDWLEQVSVSGVYKPTPRKKGKL